MPSGITEQLCIKLRADVTECIRPVQALTKQPWVRTRSPTPSWGPVGSRWLLGEEESVCLRCGPSEATHVPVNGSVLRHIIEALNELSGLNRQTQNYEGIVAREREWVERKEMGEDFTKTHYYMHAWNSQVKKLKLNHHGNYLSSLSWSISQINTWNSQKKYCKLNARSYLKDHIPRQGWFT